MDYEKKYKEALERAKEKYTKCYNPTLLDYIFPELKESEDEKMKESCKFFLNLQKINSPHSISDIDKCIAWLEKRDKNNKPLYIRFGDIPKNEKSKVYNGEIEIGTEKGVSVYPAFEDLEGNIVLGLSLPITKTTLYTQQHLIEYDDRPCYLVTGDYIGKDTDGQPLINNVSIIEKIDTYRVKEKMQSEQKVRCTALMETEVTKTSDQEEIAEIPFGAKDSELQEATYYIPEGFHAEINDDKVVIKKGEKSTAWSEKDEKMYRSLHNTIYAVQDCVCDSKQQKELSDFLDSLKNRVQQQSKQEWSAEDNSVLKDIKVAVASYWDEDTENIILDWLKSLKQRIGG